jgi:site-specific DNA-cytosine methylase
MKSLADLGIPTPIVQEAYFGERRVYNDYCPTLTRATGGGHIPLSNGERLTPYQCGLLMGLTPEESEKLCASGLSNTRLYGCLGNSIVVDVLVKILEPIVKTGA